MDRGADGLVVSVRLCVGATVLRAEDLRLRTDKLRARARLSLFASSETSSRTLMPSKEARRMPTLQP